MQRLVWAAFVFIRISTRVSHRLRTLVEIQLLQQLQLWLCVQPFGGGMGWKMRPAAANCRVQELHAWLHAWLLLPKCIMESVE